MSRSVYDAHQKEHEPVYLIRRRHGELVLMVISEHKGLMVKLKATEDEDVEWVAEIKERYRAVKEGTVACIPAEEAMRQSRERIKR